MQQDKKKKQNLSDWKGESKTAFFTDNVIVYVENATESTKLLELSLAWFQNSRSIYKT